MKKTIKRTVKQSLKYCVGLSNNPKIIVASMGRCGSSIVHDAISRAVADRILPGFKYRQSIISDVAWEPLETIFQNGLVYKTHAFPEEFKHVKNVKFIFVYGPASDSAISILSCKYRKSSDWIKEHLKNLRANGPIEDIVHTDVARFKEQIEKWTSHENTFPIEYSSLWKRQKEMENFLGFKIDLPLRRNRESTKLVSKVDQLKIKESYPILDAEIKNIAC